MDLHASSMGNVNSSCEAYSNVAYSRADGLYTIDFNHTHFISTSSCTDIILPSHMGYHSNLDNNIFKLTFDITLLAISISNNYGYTSMILQTDYEIIDFSKTDSTSPRRVISGLTFSFNEHTYIGNYYINHNLPGISPMYCIVNINSTTEIFNFPISTLTADGMGVYSLCFMSHGDTLYIPILNHFGYQGEDQLLEPRSCRW